MHPIFPSLQYDPKPPTSDEINQTHRHWTLVWHKKIFDLWSSIEGVFLLPNTLQLFTSFQNSAGIIHHNWFLYYTTQRDSENHVKATTKTIFWLLLEYIPWYNDHTKSNQRQRWCISQFPPQYVHKWCIICCKNLQNCWNYCPVICTNLSSFAAKICQTDLHWCYHRQSDWTVLDFGGNNPCLCVGSLKYCVKIILRESQILWKLF